MANTQAMTTSFKAELFNSYHNFSATNPSRSANTADAFKALLVKTASSPGANAALTNVGTPGTGTPSTSNIGTDEVSGAGYTAGGVSVAFVAPTSANGVGYTTPNASIVFSTFTSAAAFDAVVLYNSTQGNRTVSVHQFTSQTITSGTLTLTMPANNDTTALIRLT